MEKQVYDFDANYEFWRNIHEDTDPKLKKISCSKSIVRKWIDWVSELPRFEDKLLNEFISKLTPSEQVIFQSALNDPSDPIYLMSLDFDICISSHTGQVIRFMEQPEYVKEMQETKPFYK